MEEKRRRSKVGMEEIVNFDISDEKFLEMRQILRTLADEFECFDNLHSRPIGQYIEKRTNSFEVLKDSAFKKCIADDSKLFASVYDKLITVFKAERWIGKMSETSNKCKENSELEKHFSDWYKCRKELIATTNSAAKELDRSLLIVNITRIISSMIEFISSFDLGIYIVFCYNITSYAYNISSRLGLITESALEFFPSLRFMGLVSTLFDTLLTKTIHKNVFHAIKNDETKFLPIKEWLGETKELDLKVKKLLFPYRINKKIIKCIKNTLEDLGEEEKIFSATVLSNLLEDPTIYKNEKFMIEAFLFCISDDVKEWYKRLITEACEFDLECEMFNFQKNALQLKESHPDSSSKLELGKYSVNQLEYIITKNIGSNLSRYFILSMSGMSIYYCLQNIRIGTKHRYSDKLRELSKNAETFLNTMEKFHYCPL